MKFRIKIIQKNCGKITYTPQVKTSFFSRWKGLLINFLGPLEGLPKDRLSIYHSRYAWTVFDSEDEAVEVIEKFKKQEFDKKETITYKHL